ncbi:hypothetical protein [Lentilactobacillus kosonis]|uniref:Uncharacterized protein n=1 Tax=Lentilactobacillus kosonis TaxID=2810561 RepID=A0A401FKI8_9LACO|nr:hypothetical protein [Lentilactobacillus kosonis]GAY72894.1 hypothetical protein NBRC111893_1040 [Lentilactobacillus kosonis]
MSDDKAAAFTEEAIKRATKRHNERVASGRYQQTASDNPQDQLLELIKNGDDSSKEYANSLIYEAIKIILEKNPHLLDD